MPIFPQQTQTHGHSQGHFSQDARLPAIITMLLAASLSPATKALYRRSLTDFYQSCYPHARDKCLRAPASTSQVLRFIAILYQQGLSRVSIRSKLSAISFWHKLHNWANPADTFVVCKCLSVIANIHPTTDPTQMPVTPSILLAISRSLDRLFFDPFEVIYYRAIFLLAFFAFLRVSEYAQSRHSLQFSDVMLLQSSLLLQFRSFKFSSQHVAKILLPSIASELCPV